MTRHTHDLKLQKEHLVKQVFYLPLDAPIL